MTKPRDTDHRKIEIRYFITLSLVVLLVILLSFTVLYQMTLTDHRVQLQEMVRSQARLMEAVAKFNAFFESSDLKGAARSATISQIRESHRQYMGFGETGEMMLAERVGDQIFFLLAARKLDFKIPPPVSFISDRGGAMDRALSQESGVITTLDHSGIQVLAAYEYLPFLEMGLVAKMEMGEVRQPFIRSALIAAGVAAILITLATLLNARTIYPLIRRVYESAELIREREQRYRDLVGNIPGAVYQARITGVHQVLYVSKAIEHITGYPTLSFTKDGGLNFEDIVNPEDVAMLRQSGVEDMEAGRSYSLEYRVIHSDGNERWVHDHGSVKSCNGPDEFQVEGVITDITKRKNAEAALAELPRKLSRYLSPQVYRSIFEGSKDVEAGNARKKLTVFFSDIVGFTSKSDTLDPDDLSYVINSYLNEMAMIAVKHGGTLDKFIGDGVVIFFGDPETRGVVEDAAACIRMSIEMQQAINRLNKDYITQGIDAPIQVRIGVATGFCTVGNFGSENRMDYTIMGRTVNLASRLETCAETGEIQVSHETFILVRDIFECEEKTPVTVKGLEKPVRVYKVIGVNDQAR
jgi:PAS domain S-box-containing protein